MNVYGFADSAPFTGDLEVAEADATDLEYGMDRIAAANGWAEAHTSFKAAQRALVRVMQAEGADPELITLVRKTKASYLTA